MEKLKKVNTSGIPFRDMRDEDKFYVDKSMLISDILRNDDRGIHLFTRPRGFGKSTNISMLDAFFNIEYRGNNWFDGLEISEHHEYDRYRNAFPVVCLDLKDILPLGNPSYDLFIRKFAGAMRESFLRFRHLLASDVILDDDRCLIQKILEKTAAEDELPSCVRELCRMLETHHGSKTIVLIDEYDRAVTDTFGSELQKPVIGFLGEFMSYTLKGNPSLQMAYMTGVMQVAKAGMFSGVNNLRVNNILSKKADERFGFTEDEVKGVLDYYGRSDRIDEVREWYDGYRFGDAEVYNPFSVMSYVQEDFTIGNYWTNSGNDLPFRWMLDRANRESFDQVAGIIGGVRSLSDLHPDMTYDDMRGTQGEDLFSLMVMTGYLKAVPRADGRFDLSVPNREVMGLLGRVLKRAVPMDDSLFRDFAAAVRDGDPAKMERLLGSLISDSSYFDLKDESDYKLAVFVALHGITWRYRAECERQEGNGRLDIILRPKDDSVRPIIMEMKVAGSEAELESEALEGIRQIHERRYYHGMSGEVLLYGISFHGVIPRVVLERLAL